MPFRSEKQRRWLWANRPDIARRWSHEYGSEPVTSEPKKKRLRKRRNSPGTSHRME